MEKAELGKITDSAISDLKTATQSLETTATILKALRQEPITYPEQTFYLISTATTRLGIVVLLLFLVQILVPLYRYNTKLAAFYDARADALNLVSDDPSGFEQIVNILSPDTVDFGKSPAAPTQQAFEFAKEVVTSQRKNS